MKQNMVFIFTTNPNHIIAINISINIYMLFMYMYIITVDSKKNENVAQITSYLKKVLWLFSPEHGNTTFTSRLLCTRDR